MQLELIPAVMPTTYLPMVMYVVLTAISIILTAQNGLEAQTG